ncbi:MAG: hypothetical protein AB9882_14690 [Ignavibacteriaceae bacterium]
MKIINSNFESFPADIIRRLTAIWAFTEATLGGFLHLMKIPFTGLIVGGLASFFICLIAYYAAGRREIWKSTIIVLIVKLAVSPYTPLTAFFSVALQGLIAELILFNPRYYRIAAPVFCLLISLIFSLQKILFTTVLFGMDFWRSLNEYTKFVSEKVFFINTSVDFALLLVIIYITMHLTGGVITAFFALKFPAMVHKNLKNIREFSESDSVSEVKEKTTQGSKQKKRVFTTILLIILISGSLLPFISTEFEIRIGYVFLVLLARGILILIIWNQLSKIIMKHFINKYVTKMKGRYSEEIASIIKIFPLYKRLTRRLIGQITGESKVKKIPALVLNFLILLIFTESEL